MGKKKRTWGASRSTDGLPPQFAAVLEARRALISKEVRAYRALGVEWLTQLAEPGFVESSEKYVAIEQAMSRAGTRLDFLATSWDPLTFQFLVSSQQLDAGELVEALLTITREVGAEKQGTIPPGLSEVRITGPEWLNLGMESCLRVPGRTRLEQKDFVVQAINDLVTQGWFGDTAPGSDVPLQGTRRVSVEVTKFAAQQAVFMIAVDAASDEKIEDVFGSRVSSDDLLGAIAQTVIKMMIGETEPQGGPFGQALQPATSVTNTRPPPPRQDH